MRQVTQTVNQDGGVVRQSTRGAWSPVQVVAVLAGLLLVVLGGIGLARTGFNFSNMWFHHTRVADLGATPLSALVELVVGVVILAGAAFPTSAKGTSAFFGAIMLAFGLIVAFDPGAFYRNWAYNRADGIFYVVVGAVLLIAAAVSPVFSSRRETIVQRAATAQSDAGYANTTTAGPV